MVRAGFRPVRLWSTPIAEELDLVPHTRGSCDRAKTQDAAQLLADREPLLRRQNHSSVFSPSTGPLRVKSIEIRDVEREEDTPMFGGKGQLFVVGLPGETSVQSRGHENEEPRQDRCPSRLRRCRSRSGSHVRISACAVLQGPLSPAPQMPGPRRSPPGWRGSRQEPHEPAPATGGQSSARFLLESGPCCATERSGELRHPSQQCTADRRESRDVERSGCLSR
jgi:hypothetical protein